MASEGYSGSFLPQTSVDSQVELNTILGYSHSREPFYEPVVNVDEGQEFRRDISNTDDDHSGWSIAEIIAKIRNYRADDKASTFRYIVTVFELLEHIDLIFDTSLLTRAVVAAFITTDSEKEPLGHCLATIMFGFVLLHYVFMLIHHFFRGAFYVNQLRDPRFFIWFQTFSAVWDKATSYLELVQYDKMCTSYVLVCRFVEDLPQLVMTTLFLVLQDTRDPLMWAVTVWSWLQFTGMTVWQSINFNLTNTLKSFLRGTETVPVAQPKPLQSTYSAAGTYRQHTASASHLGAALSPKTGQFRALNEELIQDDQQIDAVRTWLYENAPPTRHLHIYLGCFFAIRAMLCLGAAWLLFPFTSEKPLIWVGIGGAVGLAISDALAIMLYVYLAIGFPANSGVFDHIRGKDGEATEIRVDLLKV